MADNPTIIDALSATLVVEYGVEIDPNIVSKIAFDSPMFDRLMGLTPNPVRNFQKSAVFGVLTQAEFTGSGDKRGSFPVGGDPGGLKVARDLKAIAKKSYGASGGLKDVDIIASSMGIAPHSLEGTRYRDDAEFLINLLYVRTRQAIDYGIVKGDKTTYPTDFDGLETKVLAANGSQVLDLLGAAFSSDKLDELIVQMMLLGIYPTAIYCNPIAKKAIVRAYTSAGAFSVNVNTGEQEAVLGVWGNQVVTPAGVLPVIADRRFSVSGAAPTFTTDIFVATEVHEGEPILYLDWQVLPTALNLARVPGFYTSQVFAVWSHLCLVEKSDWYAQGKLDNVTVTYAPTPPTIKP